jgi:ribosome-associated protein
MKHFGKDKIDHSLEPPSKSQRKRDMHDLQALGQTLTSLSPANLRKLPLDEHILIAILDAQSFKNEALRRQLQYIGKLMRNVDPEPLRVAIENINKGSREENKRFHDLEKWRDRLISDDKDAQAAFLLKYPHTELSVLAELIHHAKHESEHPHSGAGRKLFRYLRDIDEASNSSSESE